MGKDKFLETRVRNLRREFKKTFGDTKGIQIFNAPGRVNIIGEHTDYNGGYVLPVAINLSLLAAAKKRNDRKVYLKSKNFSKKVVASLDELKYEEKKDWANYPLSVAWALEKEGVELMLCSGLGPRAITMFEGFGIKVFVGTSGTVKDAIAAWNEGKLAEATDANACREHSHH